MEKRGKKILIISIVSSIYILVFILYMIGPFSGLIEEFSRIFALFGLLSLLISSMMAAFTKEIYQIFGKPFKTVHHYIALFGLGLIILHPIFIAILNQDPRVFIPDFSSWQLFWILAGRPALYLIILAVIAGFLQKKIRRWWRYIHVFNYVAVTFGVIHGMLIGSHLSVSLTLKIIYGTLLVLVAVSFALKRYQTYKRKKKSREKQEIEENKEN